MGHACNSGCSNLFGTLTPDSKVQYTGPAIPALNICTGNFLSEVESVILGKIIDYSTGVGISIPSIDLTTCDAFIGCVTCCGSCTDLPCLLECYKNAICSIFNDLKDVKAEVDALMAGPYNTACISGLTTNPTLTEILQKWLLDYCTLKAQVVALQTQVNTLTTGLPTTIGNFLLSAITSCTGVGSVVKSGSGATASIAFKGFSPVGAVIPFAGPTAGRFDSTGLGLPGTDMCGWAMANGNNGTVDMTGLVPLGTTSIGGTPPVPAFFVPLSTGGDYSVTLNSSQIPSVGITGTVTAAPHDHILSFNQRNGTFTSGGTNGYMDATSTPGSNTGGSAPFVPANNSVSGTAIAATISSSTVNINTSGLATGGGGGSHNNIQPYRALYYIQRIS